MDLDGVLARTELERDLLVEEAASHQLAHFTLAPGQERQALGGIPLRAPLLFLRNRSGAGARQGLEQLRLVDRLHQEVDGPLAHGARGRGDVALAAEEDDRQRVSTAPQINLHVEPALPFEAQIEKKTGEALVWRAGEKLRRRSEPLDDEIVGPQQQRETIDHQAVIVDDEHPHVLRHRKTAGGRAAMIVRREGPVPNEVARARRRHCGRGHCALGAILLCTCLATPAAQSPSAFTVLALHMASDDPISAEANLIWYATLREVLQALVRQPVDVIQEFVPADRLGVERDAAAVRDYLRERYRDLTPDLVIASPTSVSRFALQYRDALFPQTPLVIGGSAAPDDAVRRAGGGVAALELSTAYRETLALALRLHPATAHVYVLIGRSPERIPDLSIQLASVAGRVPLTFIGDLAVPEMLDAVRSAPADSLIFYVNYIQEIRGRTLTELDIAPLVASASPVPVYGFLEAHVGLGIVGGVVLTARNEATQLATLAARILNGERAQDIPVEPVELAYIFDGRQLQRWDVEPARLPAGSEVRFQEPSVWQRYRGVIAGTIALVVVQTVLIVGLVVQRARRRQIEAALRASQERYALAAAAGRVGVWEWGPGTGTFHVDRAVQAMIGDPLPHGQQALDAWLAHVHPDDRATVRERMQDHLAGRSAFFEAEHRILHRDGTVLWVLARGRQDQTDGAARVVGTLTDTTERKRAEQRLREAQGELARIARVTALGEFAASIAHEVRQPLTAIISSARASMRFLRQGAAEDAAEALSCVLDASKRADAVIERNRELFRNRGVRRDRIDLNTVVGEAARMARPRLESGHVSLVMSLSDVPPVEGDAIELQQVLLNLIANAVDAMETTSSRARRLTLATSCLATGGVQVSVSDTGVGLDGVDMDRLFAMSYTTKATGTGVGLSVSRSIVDAHGGRLWAEPAPGGGAVFSFTIPAAGAAGATLGAAAV